VSGAENAPLNTWRIVHLTSEKNKELVERFGQMSQAAGLPEYVERYIEDVLERPLIRKH